MLVNDSAVGLREGVELSKEAYAIKPPQMGHCRKEELHIDISSRLLSGNNKITVEVTFS